MLMADLTKVKCSFKKKKKENHSHMVQMTGRSFVLVRISLEARPFQEVSTIFLLIFHPGRGRSYGWPSRACSSLSANDLLCLAFHDGKYTFCCCCFAFPSTTSKKESTTAAESQQFCESLAVTHLRSLSHFMKTSFTGGRRRKEDVKCIFLLRHLFLSHGGFLGFPVICIRI